MRIKISDVFYPIGSKWRQKELRGHRIGPCSCCSNTVVGKGGGGGGMVDWWTGARAELQIQLDD
jgi:hypothetical protein